MCHGLEGLLVLVVSGGAPLGPPAAVRAAVAAATTRVATRAPVRAAPVGAVAVATPLAATAATTAAATLRATAVGLLGVGGRPAQARADLVGDDLDLRALLAVLGLPAALLEPAVDDDPGALGQALGDVVGQAAPARDVEEGGGLLPFVALA